MRPNRIPADRRLTVFLPDGAVAGRALEFTQTGMTALVEGEVPRGEPMRFVLHLQGGIISGEVRCLGQEDRVCRLQFAALTARDRDRLEPFMLPDSDA